MAADYLNGVFVFFFLFFSFLSFLFLFLATLALYGLLPCLALSGLLPLSIWAPCSPWDPSFFDLGSFLFRSGLLHLSGFFPLLLLVPSSSRSWFLPFLVKPFLLTHFPLQSDELKLRTPTLPHVNATHESPLSNPSSALYHLHSVLFAFPSTPRFSDNRRQGLCFQRKKRINTTYQIFIISPVASSKSEYIRAFHSPLTTSFFLVFSPPFWNTSIYAAICLLLHDAASIVGPT
jgi:hypothetical protein